MLTAYVELLDGLRSHYARRERDDWAATFSAAMLLSMLFTLNVAAFVCLADLLLHSDVQSVVRIADEPTVIVSASLIVGALHVLLANQAGIFHRRGGPKSSTLASRMRRYLTLTVCNFTLALVATVVIAPFGN